MDHSATLAQPVNLRPDFSASDPPEDSQSGRASSSALRDGVQHFAWLLATAPVAGAHRYQFLLLLRFALINLIGFGLLALAQVHGWVALTLSADHTRLVAVIFLVFLAGLVHCAYRIVQTSRELNRARPFDPLVSSLAAEFLAKTRGRNGESRSILISTLRLKLTQRISIVRYIANSLVLLGLIGTVIGFIIALSGVDPDKAGDFNAVAPMVSTLIDGMSTALYTTLVGAVLNVWLMVNYHLLAGGTVKLITALVELGEEHAGP
jgi:biopolymer transport protein ExbB/TolQ